MKELCLGGDKEMAQEQLAAVEANSYCRVNLREYFHLGLATSLPALA